MIPLSIFPSCSKWDKNSDKPIDVGVRAIFRRLLFIGIRPHRDLFLSGHNSWILLNDADYSNDLQFGTLVTKSSYFGVNTLQAWLSYCPPV